MRTRTLFITALLAGGLASCSLYSSDPTEKHHHPTTVDAPNQPQIDAAMYWPDAGVIVDSGIYPDASPNPDSGFYPDAGLYYPDGQIIVNDAGSGSGCNHDGGVYVGDAPIQDPIDAAEW